MTSERTPLDPPAAAAPSPAPREVGVVIIGRNEGERLQTCVQALLQAGVPRERLVYADSGSGDGSPGWVSAQGIDVIALEPPFTAAKGRNAGFQHLTAKEPSLAAVQFVDGDCEYFPAWLDVAWQTLAAEPDVVAVTGIQRERRPEASIYNLLCEVEWTGRVGEIDTFAGNVMIRVSALQAGGLYDPTLIAGEDPECAVRVKKATGGRIVRIDEPMCLHDVDMRRFSQWWKRNVRAGHAYAEVSTLHGEAPLHFWKREVRSNWLWGAVVPAASVVTAPSTSGLSIAGWGGAWTLLFWRVYRDARRRGLDAHSARVYAGFTTVGKLPQALGQATYWWARLRGQRTRIIEYKDASPPAR